MSGGPNDLRPKFFTPQQIADLDVLWESGLPAPYGQWSRNPTGPDFSGRVFNTYFGRDERKDARTALEYYEDLTPDQKAFVRSMFYTAEEICVVLGIPQRTKPWHDARAGRHTGSNSGKDQGRGHFNYEYEPDVQRNCEKRAMGIQPEFSAAAKRSMKWGNDMEDPACAQLEREQALVVRGLVTAARAAGQTSIRYGKHAVEIPADLDMMDQASLFKVHVPGLLIHPVFQWIAGSADGIVCVLGKAIGILEIKCPAKKMVYPLIPLQYSDQMDHNALAWGFQMSFFYVWTPTESYLELFPTKQAYLDKVMVPALTKAFFLYTVPTITEHNHNTVPAAARLNLISGSSMDLDDDDDDSVQKNIRKEKKFVTIKSFFV
jgi:hypothetical protein